MTRGAPHRRLVATMHLPSEMGDVNAFILRVPCYYCGAEKGEPCRHTMLDGRPVTEPHKVRQGYAWTVGR